MAESAASRGSALAEGIVPALEAEFDDVAALCASVRSWNLEFRPLRIRNGSGRVARIVQQHCGPLELSYARFEASIEQLGTPPPGKLTFAVIEEGVRRLWWRGHDVDSGTALVFLPGVELRSLSGPDFEVHTITIGVESVRRISEQFQQPLLSLSRGIETFRLGCRELAMLRQRLRQLRDGCMAPPNAGRLHDAQLVAEILVLAWLRGQTTGLMRSEPVGASARSRDRAMRVCLERIEQPSGIGLTPSSLCEVSGVSGRTLQYAFRERFGLTPAAFLKARRLALVRTALIESDPSYASVGDLAAEFGFWHTGQFAADYRRAFGEAPSKTIERAEDRSRR